MSISIRFDNNNMPIEPTLVLMTRSGKKLGAINAHNINATDNLNSYSELFFSVNKTDAEEIWDSIVDFKLVWVREWNQVYEIYVEYKESQGFIKNVTAKSLGHAELSQINIYNLNANNDTDIENDDVRTVLYNSSDHSHSLLHRIIDEKAPHYTVNHVDTWIRSIQRTFEFNNINILEAFNQIAEELDCIIFVDTSIDGTTGLIKREINVYDLEYYCSGSNCNYRGNFVDACPICGGTNILPGYGNDTTIFVSADNLSDEIDLSVNTDSVKNCFKLEAGDELMTATVMNCNPNGSQYLWYITDETKADMPSNLVDKIEDYDELYEDYQTTHSYDLSSATTNFNTVANTYKTYDASLKTITSPVAGFQNLMESYYDAIDLRIFVSDKCMPEITIPSTTAATQVGLLTNVSLSPVAVQSLSTVSTATATSYVLAIAKTFINSNYELDATATTGVSKTTVDGVVTAATWTGTFTATSYSDETDSATSSAITVSLTDNYSDFLKQRIKKILSSDEDDNDNNLGIIALFNKTLDTDTTPNFYTELHKYSLSSLKIFESCCQGCLDVLISIGAGNTNTWYDDSLNLNDNYDDDVAVVTYTGTSSTGGTVNYYRSFYKPYYKRLLAIQSEIVTREGELEKVDAMMDLIQEKVVDTQEALDFRAYLGTTLWNIFSSYRRDDVFSNENFVSDGLDNAELFNMAREFLNDATKEIYKSANLQHSITATLSNLLVMKEFAPIVDYFKVGNWIRVRIEDNIYKLRLISYSVDFDNLSNITVEFSDITRMIDGLSDIESLLNSASSMATSYDYVKRQSKKGLASNEQLRHWVEDGLSLTNLKIVSTAEEQDVAFDEHGILAREYLPLIDSYDDKQLKIINRGLYVTNDKWQTCKAGIGDFLFYDPAEGEVVEGYGVIADTIVGKIILGQEVGIYNSEGSVTINEDGMKICADMTGNNTTTDTMFKIQRKVDDETAELGYKTEDLLALTSGGEMVLNGRLRVNTTSGTQLSDLASSSYVNNQISSTTSAINTSVDSKISAANNALSSSIANTHYTKSQVDANLQNATNLLNGSISSGVQEAKTYADGAVASAILSSSSTLTSYVDDFVEDLQEQIDNKIQTYSQTSNPSDSWAQSDYADHVGDIWYNPTAKVTKRWSGASWSEIHSAEAESAKEIAETKAQVFTGSSVPSPPYYVGDLWITATDGTGVVKTCTYELTTGTTGNSAHWAEGLKYTNESAVGVAITNAITSAQSDMETYVDNFIEDLQSQIDNKIQTYSQSTPPSDSWSQSEYSEHVGDIWYNSSTNVTKRWSGSAWEQIRDSEAVSAKQLAETKARVFTGSSTPTPPYYVGDLWITDTSGNGVMKTCTVNRSSAPGVTTDWVEGLKYTDNASVGNAIQQAISSAKVTWESYTDDLVEDLQDQIDNKVQTFSQTSDPSVSWSQSAYASHTGDIWYNPTAKVTKRWSGSAWVEIQSAEAESARQLAESKAQIFTGALTPTPPYYIGDLWITATDGTGVIKTCVANLTTGSSGNASHWVEGVKYTDDTTVNNMQIGGRNILLKSNSGGLSSAPSSYLIAQYSIASGCGLVSGEIYSISVNFTNTSERTGICPYIGGGSYNVGAWKIMSSAGMRTFTWTFQATSSMASATQRVDIYCSTTGSMQGSASLSGTCTVNYIKLEKGNKATDWTPAPEDVASDISSSESRSTQRTSDAENRLNNSIAESESRLNNTINSTSDAIVSELNNIIDTKLYIGSDTQSSISQQITDSATALQEYTNEMIAGALRPYGTWLDVLPEGVKIGNTESGVESSFYTLITNSSIEFCQNDHVVAYISNQQLFINNATINDRLLVGNYFFSVNADGGMTIVWIDD